MTTVSMAFQASAANEGVSEIVRPFIHGDDTYRKLGELMVKEMRQGLSASANHSAVIKMFPTYVRSLPDGSEKGEFMALDLGGTNFRVLLITVDGTNVTSDFDKHQIPLKVMKGPGEQLFDFLAGCVASFLEKRGMKGKKLPIGFTFSFPVQQQGLASGKLSTWTKGFECPGVVGEDVVRLLHEAIARRGDLNVECVALINDTVGCLMSAAHGDHDCRIGVILGTGTNAAYMEKLGNVGTWDGDSCDPKQVVINTEWGAFGDNGNIGFMRTKMDKELDQASPNLGKQTYEKMISGRYLGELVRLTMLQCAQSGHLFEGKVTDRLKTPNVFDSKFISDVENDPVEGCFKHTKDACLELGYENVTDQDCQNVHFICRVVGKRAAKLAGMGIAVLINQIGVPKVTVAIDGSLFRFHPKFPEFMSDMIKELIDPGRKFQLVLSEDGSGRGAALVAAIAMRLRN